MPGQWLLALDGGYVQSHDNPEGMEGKVAAESGVAQAESLVVLGDGASWITEIAAWHFPQAKRLPRSSRNCSSRIIRSWEI